MEQNFIMLNGKVLLKMKILGNQEVILLTQHLLKNMKIKLIRIKLKKKKRLKKKILKDQVILKIIII